MATNPIDYPPQHQEESRPAHLPNSFPTSDVPALYERPRVAKDGIHHVEGEAIDKDSAGHVVHKAKDESHHIVEAGDDGWSWGDDSNVFWIAKVNEFNCILRIGLFYLFFSLWKTKANIAKPNVRF